MSRDAAYETSHQVDTAICRSLQGVKETAYQLGGAAADVGTEVVHSQPVAATQGFLGRVSAGVWNAADAGWSRLIRFCHEHTHIGSAVTIWLVLSTIPVIVFAGFTVGLFLTTVLIAFATFLVPVNGAVMFFSGPTLVFSLFATTILAGFTYFWLFAAGLAVNGFRRVFPSTPAQRIDEGIASKY